MSPTLVTSLVLLLVLSCGSSADPMCVMQGNCGENENGVVPCVVSKEPHKFEDSSEVLKILQDECPELVSRGGDGIPDVCCSPDDVLAMQKLVKAISSQLSDCPACGKNINEFICHLHCAPNQAEFLQVNKSVDVSNGTALATLMYFVDQKSLEDLFQICSKAPLIKTFVSTTAGCGDKCVAKDYAAAVGSRDRASPFQVMVQMVPKDQTVTVNGKPGSPVQFLLQKCADTNTCSDVCPF